MPAAPAAAFQAALRTPCAAGGKSEPGADAEGEDGGPDKGGGTPGPSKPVCTWVCGGTARGLARAARTLEFRTAAGLPRAVSDALRHRALEASAWLAMTMDRFRVKPSAPKSRGGPRSQRFVSQVLKEVSKAGAKRSGKNIGRPANTFGRGRLAASMAGQKLGANARRVVIKSRFVVLRRASPNSVAVHLRYIERDGVTRDGQKGQAYGADTDAADLKSLPGTRGGRPPPVPLHRLGRGCAWNWKTSKASPAS
jgi:hypothetical protein